MLTHIATIAVSMFSKIIKIFWSDLSWATVVKENGFAAFNFWEKKQ